MRKAQVLKMVRQILKKFPLRNIEIDVVGSATHTKDDFWYVPWFPAKNHQEPLSTTTFSPRSKPNSA